VNAWVIVVVIGAGTYLTRLSFVGMLGSRAMPAWAERPLKYVAPAVLAALTLPAVLLRDGSVDLTPAGNPRFLAAVAAAVVVVRFRSVSWAIVTGMGALWMLQWVI
jgi:branched-subunit amino acid transport protein